MTKKHFKAIAEIIAQTQYEWADSQKDASNGAIGNIAELLSIYFQTQNSNFKPNKFLHACEIKQWQN